MMNNPIGKLAHNFQQEGLASTLRKTGKALLTYLGIRESATYIFRMSIEKNEVDNRLVGNNMPEGIRFVTFSCMQELSDREIILKKLYSLPAEKWFSRNSICLALILNECMVAYTWIHYERYEIDNAGTLILDNDEAFIGPFYTDELHRGKGLYYHLMHKSIEYLKINGTRFIYGSSNWDNVATIKVCVRSGFEIVGIVRKRSGNDRIRSEFTREQLIHSNFE